MRQLWPIWCAWAYCLWSCRDLPGAWLYAPYEHWSWLALLIWLTPVLRDKGRGVFISGQRWQVMAVVLAALSAIADLRLLAHIGLALLVFGAAPASRQRRLSSAVWLLSAISWMPASGWLLSHLPAPVAAMLRVTTAALTSAWCVYIGRRSR